MPGVKAFKYDDMWHMLESRGLGRYLYHEELMHDLEILFEAARHYEYEYRPPYNRIVMDNLDRLQLPALVGTIWDFPESGVHGKVVTLDKIHDFYTWVINHSLT